MSIFVFCIGRASIVHEIERQAQQMLGFQENQCQPFCT